jgi:hypothetical protein
MTSGNIITDEVYLTKVFIRALHIQFQSVPRREQCVSITKGKQIKAVKENNGYFM